MSNYKKFKKRVKLYLLKRKLNNLKKDLKKVELHLYFDGWTGADCIEETNYLIKEIKEYEKIISMYI